VTDDLPAGVTFVSATPSQGTCSQSNGTVTCPLGTLASTGSASVDVKIRPQGEGSITNSASVSSDIFEPNPADNSASATTTVTPAADLSITKSDSPDPIAAGQLLTYTLTAHNDGPSSATGVQVDDNLASGVNFSSATPSQGTCSENTGTAGGTVSCLLGTIASGQGATIDIKVRPQNDGSITNTAGISSEIFDPSSADNSASADTAITPAADLSLTNDDSPDPVPAGQLLTYTLTAHNSGPSGGSGVQLSDSLPAGVTFHSATPSQGTCSESSGTVDCALGAIASGQSATVDIEVRPSGEDSLTNTAGVSSDTFDPNTSDNSASATTTVTAGADLALTNSDSPDPVVAGQLLTYTLTTSNAGPSTATGVQVTDDLPAGVTFVSATPSQGTCSQSNATVTCPLGTIAADADATVDVKVRPQSAGSITNSAGVSSDAFDPSSADNSASAETTVTPAADLSLTKSDAPDPIAAGQALTYTLTAHNAGPSSATSVQIDDTLPAGVTYDSATTEDGTCSESSGTVSCTLGTLASGQTATVYVVVYPQSEGSPTNAASVSSDVFDPSSSDNSATASTTVVTPNYVRPKGASPFRASLVPAYQECTAPNSTHGAPLSEPSCKPPGQSSSYLTSGTPDVNGAPAGGMGSVLLRTHVGSGLNPSDVLINAVLADVRCKAGVATCGTANSADGPDYTGELQVTYSLRLTDRFNDPTSNTPGTGTETSFPVTMTCSATASLSTGATCAVNTTANSVMPGSVRAGDRAIWQIGKVQVFDGGPDGVIATADNSLFQTQGIFLP
jgi:uncharacterized repeat protein (TIGR01451 family)